MKKLHKQKGLSSSVKQTLNSMFFVLLLTVFFTVNSVHAQSNLTIPVSEDAYAWGAWPDNNYNTAEIVTGYAASGENNRNAYFKFNINGITGAFSKATLRLYQYDGVTGARQLHSIADDTWSETTLTFRGRPALVTDIADLTTNGIGWVEIDVTAYVQAEYAAVGDNLVSLGLTTPATSPAVIRFISKENANPENAAQLVIDYSMGIDDKNIVIETYPNPVSNELNISLANANLDVNSTIVTLYTITGIKVLENKLNNAINAKVDVSKLNSGIYVLSIDDKLNNNISKKIVKL